MNNLKYLAKNFVIYKFLCNFAILTVVVVANAQPL